MEFNLKTQIRIPSW